MYREQLWNVRNVCSIFLCHLYPCNISISTRDTNHSNIFIVHIMNSSITYIIFELYCKLGSFVIIYTCIFVHKCTLIFYMQ